MHEACLCAIEAFIKVIEIACETSQISATSHTSSSSYDSNIVNNNIYLIVVIYGFNYYTLRFLIYPM